MNKFATHLCIFNQDQWLDKHINMIGNHVDKIFLSYSDVPWSAYNPNARNIYKNNFKPDSLKNNQFYSKIEFIKGEWDNDESQRNSCLEAAKNQKFNYFFILDADEFIDQQSIINIKKQIEENANYDLYCINWCSYWKSFNNLIVNDKGSYILGTPQICLNLKSNPNIRFIRCRIPNSDKSFLLDGLLHHGSYVLTNEQCRQKINTWGHAHQFNTSEWYQNKWLSWDINKNNSCLHPISPCDWAKVIERPKELILPEVLREKEFFKTLTKEEIERDRSSAYKYLL